MTNLNDLAQRFQATLAARDPAQARLFAFLQMTNPNDSIMRDHFAARIQFAEQAQQSDDGLPHPTEADGVGLGSVFIGHEILNNSPVRAEIRREGGVNTPVIAWLLAGMTGSGKSTAAASIAIQSTEHCRVLAFTRNQSFARKIPPHLRERFTVFGADFLKLSPVHPAFLPLDAPVGLLRVETIKLTSIFCDIVAHHYSRKDAVLLLKRGIEALLEELGTFKLETPANARRWPSLPEILEFFESGRYREKLPRSELANSLVLVLGRFASASAGVLDHHRSMSIQQLIDESSLIISTEALDAREAAALVELVMGQLWCAAQHRLQAAGHDRTTDLKLLWCLDDFQESMIEGGLVTRVIKVARHRGWGFILGPQTLDISEEVIANCQCFMFLGPQVSQTGLTRGRAILGIAPDHPLAAELNQGAHGRAIVRQPMGAYRGPVLLHLPNLVESPLDEFSLTAARAWVDRFKPTEPAEPPQPAAPMNSEAGKELDEQVKRFVVSANVNWDRGLEVHLIAANCTSGNDKDVLLRQVVARGLAEIDEKDRVISPESGKRIQLTRLTPEALRRFELQEPEELAKARGNRATRFYQVHLAKVLRAVVGIERVEIEGQLGPSLKRCDILGWKTSGKAVVTEFVSASADPLYEAVNARTLHECSDLIENYIVVAEHGVLRAKLHRMLKGHDPRLVVTSFFEFCREPSAFVSNKNPGKDLKSGPPAAL